MKWIRIEEVQEQLSELIDQLDDEGMVITKDGEPVAKLTRYDGVSAQQGGKS